MSTAHDHLFKQMNEHQPAKIYSPYKTMGGLQMGNDVYQAMGVSSRGGAYSSHYGQSNAQMDADDLEPLNCMMSGDKERMGGIRYYNR